MTDHTITTDAAAPNDGTDVTALIDVYFDMWRAADPRERAELVDRSFTDDGRHVDPAADVAGHDELAAMLEGVHGLYPGFSIQRTSGIDRHGAQLRYAWALAAADGTPLLTGIDVAELADDGRLARVAGFWGELPDA